MMMNLEAEAGRLLKQRGQSVACAESCTGGLVTSRLTDVAGSSAYVHGSVVCYTNDIKQRVVGVKARTLTAHTAISAQTAQEMAESIRKLMDTDYGISCKLRGQACGAHLYGCGRPPWYGGAGTPLHGHAQRYQAEDCGYRAEDADIGFTQRGLRGNHYGLAAAYAANNAHGIGLYGVDLRHGLGCGAGGHDGRRAAALSGSWSYR